MKKFYCLFAVAALFFVASCSSDDSSKEEEYPVPDPQTSYILEGSVNTEGHTWLTNSEVGLYSTTASVKAVNQECKIVGWADPTLVDENGDPVPYTPSEYEGKEVARFNTPALDLVQGENSFMIYSPYDAELVYVSGKIYGLSIDDEQTMKAPNIASDCFSLGTTTGIPGKDEVFKFELNPITALAQVSISSSELVGYSPSKVTIWDETGSSALSGGFNVTVADMSFEEKETSSKVSVTISNPTALSSGSSQNIYLNVLPGDFSSKELWVIVELVNDEGNHVTIPLKKTGLEFVAGQTTTIDVSNLTRSQNAASEWYETDEKRLLAGAGYAYGDANTYFIQCKSGSTYNGATYSPNSEYPEEVKIDIKARGDFSSVVDPRGATFEWARLGAYDANGINGTGTIYTGRVANYEASNVDPTQYEFSYDGDVTVTVKNTGAYAGSPILLMIKNNKVLWSWTFWNIAADGTTVEPITYGDYQLANMEIGQPTTQYDTWVANKAGSNPDPIFRMTNYYQFGRPIPVFWTTYWTVRDNKDRVTGNCPILYGPMSLVESIANPVGVIVNETDNTDLPQWQTEKVGDLWGNCNDDQENIGTKSIYDPCPKGWRVPDLAVYKYIAENITTDEAVGYTYEDTPGYVGIRIGDNLFPTNGYNSGKIGTNGRFNTMGMGAAGTASTCKWALLWSNYTAFAGANQPFLFKFQSSGQKGKPEIKQFFRTVAAPVRCEVDKDNR